MTVSPEDAWTEYEAAGDEYRSARGRLARACLMGITAVVRDAYPTATHVVLGASDQGPYLSFSAIIDPECGEDDYEIEEPDGIEDPLWSYSTDLEDEDPLGHWQAFVIDDPDSGSRRHGPVDPTGRVHSYVLDLDLIEFCEGDHYVARTLAA